MDNLSSYLEILFPLYLFLFLFTEIGKRSKVSRLPPGPRKLPIIGNMHQLVGLPHRVLRQLAQKYAPLMYLQLGEIPTIVVSNAKMAKEVMKTHDAIFACRPPVSAAHFLSYDSKDIAFRPYGEYWRQIRKICSLELLSAKRVRDFRPVREEEVEKLVKRITSHVGTPVNVTEIISATNYTITSRSVFGKKCKDQEKFISLVIEMIQLTSGFDIGDVFPSAKWLHFLNGSRRRLARVHQESDQIIGNIINEHRERKLKDSPGDGNVDQDLIDTLLKYEGSEDNEFSLETDQIKAIILVCHFFRFLSYGTETSATTVDWAIVEMVRNPKTLKKAQAEVRQIFSRRGIFDEAALSELHYLKQIIKETLRLHTSLPLLIPRHCGESCEIDGYEIPLRAKVIVNAWAIGRDPTYWSDPDSFFSERFRDTTVDYRGNNFEYIPFGGRRRICPGMLLGLANVELFLAKLLYYFDWKLPIGVKPEDLNMMMEALGTTARRIDDLYLIPTLYQLSSSATQD